jgi:hypothetical protein
VNDLRAIQILTCGAEAKIVKTRLFSVVSRRGVMHALTCAAASGAGAGAPNRAAAKGKRSKADVEYQDTPHGIERCEICAPFIPPDQCRTVVGPVSRQGWCKIYEGVTSPG